MELSASRGFGGGCQAGPGSQRAGGLGDLSRRCRVRPQPHSYCDPVSYHVTEISPQCREEWEPSHPGPPSLGIGPSPMEPDGDKTRCCAQPPMQKWPQPQGALLIHLKKAPSPPDAFSQALCAWTPSTPETPRPPSAPTRRQHAGAVSLPVRMGEGSVRQG